MTAKQPLSVSHPELAKQAVGWDPSTVTAGSHFKGTWVCKLGHISVVAVHKRTGGRGCPICSGYQPLTGFNDLAFLNPELAKETDGWDPSTIIASSHSRKDWMCKFGHRWTASIKNRNQGAGCPIFAGKEVLQGFNDLATVDPELAMEAFGWDSATVTSNSGFRKVWHCRLGHTWAATVNDRSNGTGCPICSGRETLAGFNDLASSRPDLAGEALGWDPTTVTKSSHKKKDWKCKAGHVWDAVVASRDAGNGCPICSGKRVLVGFNDLSTVNPDLAQQAFGWDPTTVTKSSNKRRNWKCEVGHEWRAVVNDRNVGKGCPSCAVSGFDPNSEGWLYFLFHPHWEMLQIGITNFPENRLMNHRKLGWELIELRGPMDGLIAREWETSILQMLKRHGARLAPEEVVGKFDGYTEAWLTASYGAKSLRELMDTVQRDED